VCTLSSGLSGLFWYGYSKIDNLYAPWFSFAECHGDGETITQYNVTVSLLNGNIHPYARTRGQLMSWPNWYIIRWDNVFDFLAETAAYSITYNTTGTVA